MRLDYVVTLKNDYTEKEMLALCEQCTDEIRNNDAIEYFAPMLIDVDRVTSFEQEEFMLHYYKDSDDNRPKELYAASNSKLSYDEWWDRKRVFQESAQFHCLTASSLQERHRAYSANHTLP